MSRVTPVLCALTVLALVATVPAGGQTGPPKYSVGQRVEAKNSFTDGWQAGTVTQVDDERPTHGNLKYLVHLDRPANDGEDDWSFFEYEVRPLQAFTPFKVGTRVDVYYSPGNGKGRGKVIAAPDESGRYLIHYDGCGKHFDERVDHTLVLKAKHLSRSSRAVHFLEGKWAMFTPSYPTTVVKDDGIYREYGTGAKAPPLTIKANGRYVWYYDYGHRPVRGRWKTDAKLPNAIGTYKLDGIVIKDSHGDPWKIYKRSTGDHKAHMTAQRVCSGLTEIGTKV
jgi:hypothetical protein